MEYTKDDRVLHPGKPEWGLGQVLSSNIEEGSVNIFFSHAGEKIIMLEYVKPIKVVGDEAGSIILDALSFEDEPHHGMPLCKNCRQPTQFTENSDYQRSKLGWCDPCFKQSYRKFEDAKTSEVHYDDEFRTIDGIKTRFTPK
jgi:hypothetical protein